jgi:signal transduction histidine kinase
MKIKYNLRFRFVIFFCLFAVFITGIFALMIFFLERTFEEEFFQRRLQSELAFFAERYQQNHQVPLPTAEDIRSYLGTDYMPSYLKKRVIALSDGIYDRDVDSSEMLEHSQNQQLLVTEDLFFGIKTLTDKQKIYLFIDFEFLYRSEQEILAYTLKAFFIVCCIAFILGLIAAHQVISPINRLMNIVDTSSPDEIPTGFSLLFKNDEIGALAKAFEASLIRVKNFIKREQQFTRDSSHELRTPVTAIKGAVELIKTTPACEEKFIGEIVGRIERSTMDIETTIESLLWLARESKVGESAPLADIQPLVENAINQNRHLIAGKPVEINLQVDENPTVSAPAGALSITIANLIRNACQYTSQGKIVVTLRKNLIEVTDTGIGINRELINDVIKSSVSSPKSEGFGFGLDIVNRLCLKYNWHLNIESKPNQGTKVSLLFLTD